MSNYPRYNARKNHTVLLDKKFYHSGLLTDPFVIEKVEIYKREYNQAAPNPLLLVETVDGVDVVQLATGEYQVQLAIPESWEANYYYVDVWSYKVNATSATTIDSNSVFFLRDDDWFVADGQQNYKYQLYPDLKQLVKGEIRSIELEVVPLPLYKTNPYIDSVIVPMTLLEVKVETARGEQVQVAEWETLPMTNLGNKFLFRVDTTNAMWRRGVYYYWIRMAFPDGTRIVSQKFVLSIV